MPRVSITPYIGVPNVNEYIKPAERIAESYKLEGDADGIVRFALAQDNGNVLLRHARRYFDPKTEKEYVPGHIETGSYYD